MSPEDEHRVREIVAEMIDSWQEDVCRGLPGPSEQMLALMAEGKVR